MYDSGALLLFMGPHCVGARTNQVKSRGSCVRFLKKQFFYYYYKERRKFSGKQTFQRVKSALLSPRGGEEPGTGRGHRVRKSSCTRAASSAIALLRSVLGAAQRCLACLGQAPPPWGNKSPSSMQVSSLQRVSVPPSQPLPHQVALPCTSHMLLRPLPAL